MLKELYIKNIAVIEETRIEFSNGFNVLTGETGAGKSILIDSIGLSIGGKASRELVRTGCEKANVSACFSSNPEADAYLEELGIDPEDDIILSRQITKDAKSSCRINGITVTAGTLKEMGRLLIDIHGQSDNYFLLSNRYHINYLDEYASLGGEIEKYAETYNKYKEINEKINSLEENEAEKQRRAELLEYQINEIESAKLKKGEIEDILTRLEFLSNIENILRDTCEAHEALYSAESNAYDLLETAVKCLNSASEYDNNLSEAAQRLESALIEIGDVAGELAAYNGKTDFDEGELNMLNSRLETLNTLRRKYGDTEEDIIGYCEKIKAELYEITNCAEILEELKGEAKKLYEKALSEAEALNKKRKAAAKKLGAEIMKELSELDMPKVTFCAEVKEKLSDNGKKELYSKGFNEVEFLISANPGEDLKPISRIASGGELSRIMLALKSIFSDSDPSETLIFDEIDTGVSGRAAQKIAEKISRLSKKKQILSITHLAQLASMADSHYLIKKDVSENKTSTTVTLLEENERINELARIIGGAYITELTLENAKEMLTLAKKLKSETD